MANDQFKPRLSERLKALPLLEQINFNDFKVRPADIDLLAIYLKRNHCVTILDIGNYPIKEDEIELLANALLSGKSRSKNILSVNFGESVDLNAEDEIVLASQRLPELLYEVDGLCRENQAIANELITKIVHSISHIDKSEQTKIKERKIAIKYLLHDEHEMEMEKIESRLKFIETAEHKPSKPKQELYADKVQPRSMRPGPGNHKRF